ncbi:MAG: hypothetical protein GQ526_00410, partial [Ardenticatenales bacterium]|nr:hypothetical protein [Ardenticatenales bacterium]
MDALLSSRDHPVSAHPHRSAVRLWLDLDDLPAHPPGDGGDESGPEREPRTGKGDLTAVIRRDINGLRYYQFASLSAEPVRHGVFSRLGGVSRGPFASLNLSASVPDDPRAVTENRRRFYAALGVDPNRAIRALQVHGARVAAVNSDDLAVVQPATDGLLTATPGLPLVMAFADCTPILLHDPVRRAVGMVHAGWRGTVAG